MPDLLGYTGTDALVLWVALGVLALGIIVVVAMLAALLSQSKKTRLSVEYMRWLADDGPAREQQAKRQSTPAPVSAQRPAQAQQQPPRATQASQPPQAPPAQQQSWPPVNAQQQPQRAATQAQQPQFTPR
jgi:type IV secretory pathway VirB10-like protein